MSFFVAKDTPYMVMGLLWESILCFSFSFSGKYWLIWMVFRMKSFWLCSIHECYRKLFFLHLFHKVFSDRPTFVCRIVLRCTNSINSNRICCVCGHLRAFGHYLGIYNSLNRWNFVESWCDILPQPQLKTDDTFINYTQQKLSF